MYVNVRAIIERRIQGELHLYLQVRNKPDQPKALELPGGQLEEYESMIEGLKREVREETGLKLVRIEGMDTYVEVESRTGRVEAIRPFAVYQTLAGPIDSMGVYFRCEAEGMPLRTGDETLDGQWMPIHALRQLAEKEPEAFSWIDAVGIRLYFQSDCHGI
ncbi:DNA mismatch repair protein MutT [Paenibacillus macerans]|uniref:NUDIX hydrolase n=1 Tax=Paenibacillus sp. FSL R5-0527 TaxID=2975321 RepID=UPI002087B007|nr:DNA mismatch repair protein MutT [Paenibacillus macerans]